MQSSTNATIGAFTNSGLNSTAIGATTPSTGAFTTLSSTGKITSGGNIQVVAAGDLTWGGNYGAGIPVINGTSGVGFTFYPGGSTTGAVAVINASGLAVTGALSASGQATFTKSANSAGSVAALLQNADGNSGIGARLAWRLDNLANEWGYINVNRVGGGATAQMDFAVNNAAYSGAPSVAMTVLGSGNVGIGTTGPSNTLQINTSVGASVPAAGSSGHTFAAGSSAYGLTGGALTNGNAYLQVTRWDGTATNYNMLLNPNGGSVGIGTTAPAAKLDVSVAGGMLRVGSASGNNLFQAYSGSVGAGIWAGGQTRLYSTGDMTLSVGATLTTAAPTGYTDALTITSAGNVGIGTTSPGATLDVNGNARFIQNAAATTGAIILRQAAADAEGAFIQWVNNANSVEKGWLTVDTSSNMKFATVSTERLRITSAGDVGIGTTSPTTQLELYKLLASNTTLQSLLTLNSDFGSAAGTGFGSAIVFRGRTAGNLMRDNAKIAGYNPDASNNGYALGFFTAPAAGQMTERLTILRTGDVGIGTTSPGARLNVVENTDLIGIRLQGGSTDTGISIQNTGTNGREWVLYSSSNGSGIGSGNFNVYQGDAGSRLAIDVNGNVGIGTVSPTEKLDVAGTVKATAFSGPLTGNAATATLAANSTLAGGLAVHSSTNNEANKIVRTDVNGYIQAGWINTVSGDNGTTAIGRVYASQDGYIRYYSLANFTAQIAAQGGSWTGSASTLVAGNQYTINRLMARQSGVTLGAGNSSQIEVNNAASGACNISFHREGVYGAHFGLDTDNWFSTYGWSAGAGYTAMRVGAFTANGNIITTGSLTVGSSTSSDIYMVDSDEGTRRIHCNSNRVGFLNQTGNWGAYCNDDGSWGVDGAITASGVITASGGATIGSTLTVNNGWSYVANNYGYGIVGLYTHTIFQLVFAMGDSYKTTAGGGINNLYGMAWSYPSAGGIAGNLDSHGMIVAINGGFGSCMSYSIVASGNVTAYSDERLKTNWSAMPENFVERLAKVRVGTYDRIDGERIRQVGVSAQSLRPLLPEAVIEGTDDFKTLKVSYGNAAMASAVELAKEVVSLKEQMAILMDRLNKLENK